MPIVLMTRERVRGYNPSPALETSTVEMLAEQPMAKRNDVPVKMDAEVVRKAKIVASYRGQTLAEFLSDTLGAIVADLLEAEHAKEAARSKPKMPKGKKSLGGPDK
jgi:hypothetical protein